MWEDVPWKKRKKKVRAFDVQVGSGSGGRLGKQTANEFAGKSEGSWKTEAAIAATNCVVGFKNTVSKSKEKLGIVWLKELNRKERN